MPGDPIAPIDLDGSTRLLVLTGAGISAESGLATFRGSGGLWAGSRVEDVATPEAFEADPARVWRFYAERRAAAAVARPNRAHLALAAAEAAMGERFLLATQNVDGLHGAAGSRRVVELHGSLWRARCARCDAEPVADRALDVHPPLPECPACAAHPAGPALMRPDIVWFGEMLDPADEWAVRSFIRYGQAQGDRLVFLAVGTSGNVYPVAGYVRDAKLSGGETWLANLDIAANADWFDHVVRGPATEVVPALLGLG
jgi:NAD-dependent deacetylase